MDQENWKQVNNQRWIYFNNMDTYKSKQIEDIKKVEDKK